MGIKSISLAATTLVLSTSVNAALVGISDTSMDFLGIAQDGFNLTVDTSNNLEWLDWRLTSNRSYSDVFAETQGGNLDGWRYATASEFEDLATSAGIPNTFFNSAPGGTHSGFDLLKGLLGFVTHTNGKEYTVAFSATSLSLGSHVLGGFIGPSATVFEIPDATSSPVSLSKFFPDGNPNYLIGSALVRDVSAVPVPAAVWLFGSGMLGLIGFARRKARV